MLTGRAENLARDFEALAKQHWRLWLAAFAAGLGLLLGLYGALNENPFANWGGPSGIVATVNGAAITDGDLDLAVETLAAGKRNALTAEDRTRMRDLLIDEELLIQRGVEIGLIDTDNTVRKTIANAMIDSVLADASRGEPDEAALRSLYESQPQAFSGTGRFHVARLFLPDGPDQAALAEKVLNRLDAGESFAKVAADLGAPSALELPDGPLPAATLEKYLGPTLTEKARTMTEGEIAGPIRAGGGLNFIQLLEVQPGQIRPYAEVRPLVEAEYERRKDDAALRSYLDWLRSRADVNVVGDGDPE